MHLENTVKLLMASKVVSLQNEMKTKRTHMTATFTRQEHVEAFGATKKEVI